MSVSARGSSLSEVSLPWVWRGQTWQHQETLFSFSTHFSGRSSYCLETGTRSWVDISLEAALWPLTASASGECGSTWLHCCPTLLGQPGQSLLSLYIFVLHDHHRIALTHLLPHLKCPPLLKHLPEPRSHTGSKVFWWVLDSKPPSFLGCSISQLHQAIHDHGTEYIPNDFWTIN